MKESLDVPGPVQDPVAPSPSEAGEKPQSLRVKRSGLQNLIDFKKMKKASEEEIAELRLKLESVEVEIGSIEKLISDEGIRPSFPEEERYLSDQYGCNRADDVWYAGSGRVQPLPDLEKRDKKLDFGGNYAGKWHVSKDYLNGDGDDS